MLQKFKITSCAFILVLFGFSLMTVSPVLAVDGDGFTVCDNMSEAASKLSCFKDLARSLRAAVEEAANASRSQEAAVDDAEGTKEALKLQIETIKEWLEEKKATIADLPGLIADLQEQLSTASSESQAKDETIEAFEQSQAEFDATIAELQEQLSTASSESQAKDETIEDLTDRLAAAMEGPTQGSGAGTASDNRFKNDFERMKEDHGKNYFRVLEELFKESRDGCEATFADLPSHYTRSYLTCLNALRNVADRSCRDIDCD